MLNVTKREFINVIAEDDEENEEDNEDLSEGAEEMNKYWEN